MKNEGEKKYRLLWNFFLKKAHNLMGDKGRGVFGFFVVFFFCVLLNIWLY